MLLEVGERERRTVTFYREDSEWEVMASVFCSHPKPEGGRTSLGKVTEIPGD